MFASADAFLSYRTKRKPEVAPLLTALADAGVTVWRDEERLDAGAAITQTVVEGLAGCRVLLAWYSLDYPESRICQWEQILAWVAAEAAGDPFDRVLVLLPPGVEDTAHLLPGPLANEKAWRVPAAPAALRDFAGRVAAHLQQLGPRPLGDPARRGSAPAWFRPGGAAAPSERFTGRAKALWDLHGYLHTDRMATITGRVDQARVQLRGLGGNGKTLLAVEYATRFGAAFPGGIFWVDAAQRAVGESVAADFAVDLGITEEPDARRIAARVRERLAERGAYLWVVDNVPIGRSWRDVEAWCAPTPNGRTLITTRSRSWRDMGKTLDLGVLDPPEALALLTQRRAPADPAEKEAAGALCAKVGYHPLTLDVLGALVDRHPTATPFADWCARLAEPAEDCLRLGDQLEDELPTGAARYVGTVLQASLAGLAPAALDLLLLAVSLAEAPIPTALAVETLVRADGIAVRTAEDRVLTGMAAAEARSLLDGGAPTPTSPAPVYSVHALVRRVLEYDATARPRRQALRDGAVQAASAQLEGVADIGRHEGLAPLVPHAEHLAGQVHTLSDAALAFEVGHYHQVRGAFGQAHSAWQRALEARTRLLGKEHPDTLNTLQNLAGTLYAQGDLAGARTLYERALDAMTRLLGKEHPDTLSTLQNLAVTLKAQGELASARTLEERALEAMTRLLGKEHPDTLKTLQNLAGTLYAQGDLAGARTLNERALEARTRLLGKEHPDTTVTRFNLVLTLLRLEPRAAAPHVAILGRLRTRDRGSLSAVEKQVLNGLDGIEAGLRSPEIGNTDP